LITVGLWRRKSQ